MKKEESMLNQQTSDRKRDHIDLAFKSQTQASERKLDLNYEPIFSAHPNKNTDISVNFLGKKLNAPLWVSSMTGGTEHAAKINKNLAKACAEFGFGMGLGSCRPLLESSDRFSDFNLREIIGENPFYANLGVAQLEELVANNQTAKIDQMIKNLQVDGLIIHVNPLQEWMQPEGDRFKQSPLKTIKQILSMVDTSIIVKEVGQGFGPKSLKSLMQLSIDAIEFGAFGGTNFTLLENTRHNALKSGTKAPYLDTAFIGHTASEMIGFINEVMEEESEKEASEIKCKQFIISGGISNALEGYALQQQFSGTGTSDVTSVVGMGKTFLEFAIEDDYSYLQEFILEQVESFKLASCFLRGKE